MAVSLSIPNIGARELIFSTGDLAKQANGSVCCSCRGTVVLSTACMSREPSFSKDFFPLTIEYKQKTYAMGKIPGGFIKKEGRPKDEEILNARLIDRPLRPLFPKGFINEVQIFAIVLSSDGENNPDVLALNAASCALFVSDIPFHKPVGAVRVSKLNGQFIVNPTYDERQGSSIDLVVVGTEEKIVMLEGQAGEVSEEEVFEAIKFSRPFIDNIIKAQKDFREKAGLEKKEAEIDSINEELAAKVKAKIQNKLEDMYGIVKKEERNSKIQEILAELSEEFVDEDAGIDEDTIKKVFYSIEEEFVRNKILEEEKRPDSRGLKDIRPIDCQVRVLPRTHGSGLFTRGQTQSLAVTTLGTSVDEQTVEGLEGASSKHFMLHYNFPPFSVGEIKMARGPSRREIGHGALAEKSLLAVVPSKEEFPYTIRIVSEILESNGSSSMASACAASLSLMDAGVPIKEPVAGIAIGLVSKGDDNYKILTDIAGVEDHCGDMDFKVAGTRGGITAIQLDTKIEGLTFRIIEETLQRAKEARNIILDKMEEVIARPREALSEYAPKIKSFDIDPDKIGALIGPGGKNIRRISRDNNVNIDIDDETNIVSVVAETLEGLDSAIKQINNLIKDVEVGEIYDVRVEKIVNFGAFCEIAPGKSGLLHISELSDGFVKEVGDYLKEGDIIKAKVIGIDPQGKIRLSAKQAK